MARIFTDGAEHGNLLFWDAVGGMTVTSAVKRSGAYSYLWPTGGTTTKNITELSEFYFRTGVNFATTTNGTDFLYFFNGTSQIARLEWEASLGVIRGRVNGSLVATSTVSMVKGEWYLLEVHYKMADAGVFEIKIDGILAFSWSGDTKPGTATTIDNIQISTDGDDVYFDDLALNDISGTADNSWCGDGRVLPALLPVGNGASSQWTGSDGDSVDNYLLVRDYPPSGDATYVEAGSGGLVDSYAMGDLSLSGYSDVLRVWVEGVGLGTVIGESVQLRLVSGAATVDSAARPLLTTNRRVISDDFLVDPNTGLAWNEAGINGLECGVVSV